MRRDARYWKTPFARWVSRYTVSRLTRELSRLGAPVTNKAIYDWLSGRRLPRPTTARAIERLSGGAVRPNQIYSHRDIVSEPTRTDEAA